MAITGTKELVIKLREKSPCMTLQAIGDRCGVSRERVRQILKSEGMETKHFDTRVKYYCTRCGKRILDPYTRNNGAKTPRKLCLLCSHEVHHVKVICSICGKDFEIKTSALLDRVNRAKGGGLYCSVACSGKAKAKYDHLFKLVARDNAKGISIRRSLINHGIPEGYQGAITNRMIKLGYKIKRPILGRPKV
jgi:DNA-directed RNA polymerase subunit RPC12/RpoP